MLISQSRDEISLSIFAKNVFVSDRYVVTTCEKMKINLRIAWF